MHRCLKVEKNIEEIIRAIAAKDISAAGGYHALSGEARKKMLGALDK
jgi:hypothetical protein